MPNRSMLMTKDEAAQILARCNIAQGSDFHTIYSESVELLKDEGKRRGYRQQRNANGSYARSFYEYVNRRLRK